MEVGYLYWSFSSKTAYELQWRKNSHYKLIKKHLEYVIKINIKGIQILHASVILQDGHTISHSTHKGGVFYLGKKYSAYSLCFIFHNYQCNKTQSETVEVFLDKQAKRYNKIGQLTLDFVLGGMYERVV